MSKGVAGAIALILLWLAFASFFVAFHPGGLVIGTDSKGKPIYAQNPRDVFLYFVKTWSMGQTGPGEQQA